MARNKNTPADVLAELATDRDYLVRRAAANNPNTPYNTLLMLSKDKELEVREKAKYALNARKMNTKFNKER